MQSIVLRPLDDASLLIGLYGNLIHCSRVVPGEAFLANENWRVASASKSTTVGFPDGAGYQPQLRALAEWLLLARVVLWFVHRIDGGGGGGRLEGWKAKRSRGRAALLWDSGRHRLCTWHAPGEKAVKNMQMKIRWQGHLCKRG